MLFLFDCLKALINKLPSIVLVASAGLKLLLFTIVSLSVQAATQGAESSSIENHVLNDAPETVSDVTQDRVQFDALRPLYNAWEEARDTNKSIMLVLGADWCDRCALLSRYLQDAALKQRVANRFVMLPMDVGSPDSLIEIEEGAEHLPIVLLIDANMPFEAVLQSDNLLTFLPEPYEPVFDWFENVLFFSEQNLALH